MGEMHRPTPAKQDFTLSIGEVNLYSSLIIIPAAALCCVSYGLVWNWQKMAGDASVLIDHYLLTIVVLITGAVLHELIHAVIWAAAGGISIHSFKYGIIVKGLALYAHCTSPLTARAYRWGAAAPGLILGVAPFLLALMTGNAFLMSYGFIFILVAGGDFLMLWKIRHLDPSVLVRDHPDRVGCEVVDNTT